MQRNVKGKFSNFSKSILSMLGILIVVLMFAVIWYWETYGRERFLYENVVVLKDDVLKGVVITNDMLVFTNFEKSKLISNPITDKEQIIGKEVKHFLPANSPLSDKYFDDAKVITKGDEFIAKIPNEWILSFPDSIRRKDKAIIYEVKGAVVSKIAGTQSGVDILNSLTPEQIQSITSKSGIPMITTTVAYVKDGTNKEIIDIGKDDRLDGSGKISSIEFILTQQQLGDLQTAYKNGSKFIILYTD